MESNPAAIPNAIPNPRDIMAAHAEAVGLNVDTCHHCQTILSSPLMTGLHFDVQQAVQAAESGAQADLTPLLQDAVQRLRAACLALKTGGEMVDKMFAVVGAPEPPIIKVIEGIDAALLNVLPINNPQPSPPPQPVPPTPTGAAQSGPEVAPPAHPE